MGEKKAFFCGDLNPKQYLGCRSDCRAVMRAHSHQQRQQNHPTITSLNYPFPNYRSGYLTVSDNSPHIYCLPIVRYAPSRMAAHTHYHHKLLFPQPSKTPQVRGHLWPLVSRTTAQQSPGLSQSLPSHPSSHTQPQTLAEKQLLSQNSPVHQKIPRSLSLSPNMYSQTLFQCTAVEVQQTTIAAWLSGKNTLQSLRQRSLANTRTNSLIYVMLSF